MMPASVVLFARGVRPAAWASFAALLACSGASSSPWGTSFIQLRRQSATRRAAGQRGRVVEAAGDDRCMEQAWPDKDHNMVCGDCKVLVDRFSSHYKTCNNYCGQLGRRCEGAWEEREDTCDILHELACDEELASSDAICECSPDLHGKVGSNASGTSECTVAGEDPYGTWPMRSCCDGLQQCNGDWSNTGRYYYLCLESCSAAPPCTADGEGGSAAQGELNCCTGLQECDGVCRASCSDTPAATCTAEGEDPYLGSEKLSKGEKLECCEGLQECIGNWENTGRWFYRCRDSCGGRDPDAGAGTATCGLAPDQGECAAEVAYLASLDSRAAGMPCMGYGGQSDPCSLSITNDGDDFGMSKDPSACTADVFFLWDEPTTQCHRGYSSCGAEWAPTQWKAYVDRWESELQAARARGMKITSPLFISGDTGALLGRFADFFQHCAECDQQGSKYYIDVLAWNAFALQQPPSPYPISEQFTFLGTLASALKEAYPGRPVYATNFGLLYAHTAMDQAAAITAYDIFNSDVSNIDGVFYFSAQDYCGRPADECTTKNSLRDTVERGPHEGKTIGQVLVETCFR